VPSELKELISQFVVLLWDHPNPFLNPTPPEENVNEIEKSSAESEDDIHQLELPPIEEDIDTDDNL